MFYFRPAYQRGRAQFNGLDSRHSFSFGQYYDPRHMGLSALRVINDDTLVPGAGFDTHSHRDMEIISYVLDGALAHKDSMGNHGVVPAGEIQRMSAGTGISHSEFNDSSSQPLRFLQIWVLPNQRGTQPAYAQKAVEQRGALTPLVTPDGRDDSLTMQQDASLFRLQLTAGESMDLDTLKRPGYLHIIDGALSLNDQHWMQPGDAVGAADETLQVIAGKQGVTALWFDLPPM